MSTEAHAFAVGQLRSFIERVERVEEEIKNLNDDKSDIYKEIRSAGFDVKTVRKIVAKRKLADDVRNEQDTLFDTYWEALTGSSLVHVHARENIEQFDPMTGEFLDDNVDPKLAHTIATGLQTETGRAALIAAVDILIEREEAEEETHQRPSTNDEPSPEAGPQAEASPAGTGTGKLADREGRHDGEAASADLSTKSKKATVAAHDEATVSHSDQRETDREAAATGVGANEGGENVESSAKRAGLEGGPVNLEPSGPEAERASFTAKPPSPLRPHCRQPQACGGYGRNHCHTCAKAMREREPAEELA